MTYFALNVLQGSDFGLCFFQRQLAGVIGVDGAVVNEDAEKQPKSSDLEHLSMIKIVPFFFSLAKSDEFDIGFIVNL